MLVGKDHVGGEGSCWWERIMLVLQDDEEWKKMIFAPKNKLFHRTDFYLSVRNINRSKLYVFSPHTFSN